MAQDEKQAFVDRMYQQRGYIHDFHKVMALEDFDFLKAYNQLLEEGYIKQRTHDRKTKELIFTALLVALGSTVEHIKLHIELALKHGATKQEILEVLEVCLVAAGVPAFMAGFEAWKQAVSPERVEPSQP
jgi:4-carboxymuconolactone decarboxylase